MKCTSKNKCTSLARSESEPQQISWVLCPLQQHSSRIAASHSSITGPHPAHTFPWLPGIKPVTPVCFSRHSTCSGEEAKWWTVAMSPCLCAWQSSSQPPLCSHQEMSFSNSVSNALNSSRLSSDKAKRKRAQLLAIASTSLAAFTVFLHLFLHFDFPFAEISYNVKMTSALVKCGFENETTEQNLQGDALLSVHALHRWATVFPNVHRSHKFSHAKIDESSPGWMFLCVSMCICVCAYMSVEK